MFICFEIVALSIIYASDHIYMYMYMVSFTCACWQLPHMLLLVLVFRTSVILFNFMHGRLSQAWQIVANIEPG